MKDKQGVKKILRLFLAMITVFIVAVNGEVVLADEGYAVYHQFVNCRPGEALPHEILNVVPPARRGYTDGSVVLPTSVAFSELTVGADTWTFSGWEAETLEIQSADVVFTGQWCQALPEEMTFDFYLWLYDSMHEDTSLSEPISGALFNLYTYNSETNDWQLTHQHIRSGTDGRVLLIGLTIDKHYRLIQTEAPTGFNLQAEHWYLSALAVGEVHMTHATDEASLYLLEDGRWLITNQQHAAPDIPSEQRNSSTIILLIFLAAATATLTYRIIQRNIS